MRKTMIKVRADLVVRADAYKAAWLEVKDGRDDLFNVADNDKEAKIDSPNVGLVEFDIQTQTSLADSVRKTCRKWAINDLIEGGHNKLITSLIMNIGAEFSTHIENFLTICQCPVDEFDCPSIDNIGQVSTDVVASWQKIIRRGGQFAAIDADMEDVQFESNWSGHYGTTIGFLELLIDEIKMSEELLTKVKYNHLSENPEVIILYDIISNWLSLNHL